jgi:hypothetical protein
MCPSVNQCGGFAGLGSRNPGLLRYTAGRRVADIMHEHDLPQACPGERIEDPAARSAMLRDHRQQTSCTLSPFACGSGGRERKTRRIGLHLARKPVVFGESCPWNLDCDSHD